MTRNSWQRAALPRWALMLVVVAVLMALAAASVADARGFGGSRFGTRRGGFGGFGGAGFFYGPFGYYPNYAGGYLPDGAYGFENTAIAAALEVGAIDLNIKPRSAEVLVDGIYRGQVRNFDGYPRRPTYLWLPAGEHTITVRKGGYPTWEEIIEVEAGVIIDVKMRLERQVVSRG